MICRCLIPLLLLPVSVYAQSTDSLLQVLKNQPSSDTSRVNTLNALAYQNWLSGEDSIAKSYSYEAIQIARHLNYYIGESNARFQLVRIEMDILEDTEAGHAHLDTVDMIAKKTNDELMKGISHFRRAQLISMTNLESPRTIDSLLTIALTLFKKEKSKYWESLIYAEQAGLLGWDGKYAEAIDLLIKTGELQESLGDKKALRATLPNLGVNYITVEMYQEALECFDAAEEIALQSNDLRVLAFVNNQRGEIYKKQNELQKALDSYSAAARIYESTNSSQFLPSAYARMSDVYMKMGRYQEALQINEMADSVFRASNVENAFYHYTQINFGNLFLHQGDFQKVIRYAKQGLNDIRDKNSFLFEQSSYHRQLSEAYQKLGSYPLAYEHLLKYKTTSDSLFNDESRQKILASTMTYQFDKMKSEKDMEIQILENKRLVQTRNILLIAALAGLFLLVYILKVNRRLKKYNTQLINKNREIEMALDRGQKIERRRVASELHDNLNTKLAALRWSLESIDTEHWDSANQILHQKLIDMANDAYKDVRLISHNMLPPELEQEGLSSAFRLLFRKLNELGDIRFHFDEYDMKRLSKNEEHQLYNVALEAINNTLKHARATDVSLQIKIENNIFKLLISDNGIGMNQVQSQKGMGIHNIKNRVESIGGQVKLDSSPGLGTTLIVTVPLK